MPMPRPTASNFGRKPILTPHQQQEARKRLEAGEPQRSVARSYNVRRFGAKPDKNFVDVQAASPSSWKTPCMARLMVW